MKIIDIAKCVDNVDPKGLGRIRVEYPIPRETSIDFEKWDKNDIYVANPFLPTNINFIPEINQSVKLLNYNVDNKNVDLEYVAGPFTTGFDFNGQTYSQQLDYTTYGNRNKSKADIINPNGKFVNDKSETTFAKDRDYGIYGKYGSDLIFTENGLQLRGGKLLSKDAASGKLRTEMLTFPMVAKKSASFYLKKFSKKLTLVEEKTTEITNEIKDIKYIVEYDLDLLTNPTKIDFYIYKVIKNNGDLTKTGFFNVNTTLPSSVIKLINTDNSLDKETFKILITDVNFISTEINDVFYTIIEDGFKGILKKSSDLYTQFSQFDLPEEGEEFPFYFRPTKRFIQILPANTSEKNFKENVLSKVKVHSIGPKSGLIWSKTELTAPTKSNSVVKKVLKFEPKSPEQTFSALKSDKIYFLSTDPNETNKTVNFGDLEKYELSQEDYIMKIDPNTFSSVRGENLLRLLMQMIDVLFKHKHNLIGPMVKNTHFDEYVKLLDLLKSVEDDILNKSIRIN